MPIETVQKGSYVDPQEVIGKYSRITIAKSEQITTSRLALNERGSGLVSVLPPDKRAITVGVTDTTGLTGLAKAGDKVDVISVKSNSGKVSGQILLQDVMIMAINRNELSDTVVDDKGNKTEKLATVTLAVNPRDAVSLALAQAQGTLQLILRPTEPSETFVKNTLIVEQGTVPTGTERDDLQNSFGVRVIRGGKAGESPATGATYAGRAGQQSGSESPIPPTMQNNKR